MKVAEPFGNNMVLQRGTAVPVWGEAEPGETVTIRLQGQETWTKADSNGNWCTKLEPLHTSWDETFEINGQREAIRFCHVAIGEVWIAAGQSNMEFHMRYDKDYEEAKKNCFNPDIRMFDYPVVISEEARKRFDFSENFGFWRTCDTENLQWFSAVGYYFAKYLQDALHVPVGIIGLNCGGTRSACWMDEETVRRCGRVWLDDYEQGLKDIPDLQKAEEQFYQSPVADHTRPFENALSDRLMYGAPVEELKQAYENMASLGILEIGPWHEFRPSGVYHTMLERVAPYAANGVLWYQGESDEDHPEIYGDMMQGLIELWRKKWNSELPFITVQLAPLGTEIGRGGEAYPELRRQQELLSKKVSGVYLAATGDIGNTYDIHPKEKQPIGKRMALLARGHVYGERILCDAPVPEKYARNGRRIEITFAHAEGGLIVKGSAVNALQVFCGGKEIEPFLFQTEIRDNVLTICIPASCEPEKAVEVVFAGTPYFEVNLYNRAEIPALPFQCTFSSALEKK